MQKMCQGESSLHYFIFGNKEPGKIVWTNRAPPSGEDQGKMHFAFTKTSNLTPSQKVEDPVIARSEATRQSKLFNHLQTQRLLHFVRNDCYFDKSRIHQTSLRFFHAHTLGAFVRSFQMKPPVATPLCNDISMSYHPG